MPNQCHSLILSWLSRKTNICSDFTFINGHQACYITNIMSSSALGYINTVNMMNQLYIKTHNDQKKWEVWSSSKERKKIETVSREG